MMEAAGLQRASVGTLLLLMGLFLPASSLVEQTTQPPCPLGDFLTEENICCRKCPPGFKMLSKCLAEGLRTNCTPCPPGQYNDEMNFAPTCRRCRRCKEDKFEVEESACERHQNTVCGCMDGFYRSRVDSVTFQCLKCSTCGPDEQEQQKCSRSSNTVCGCKENFYKHGRVCEACKNCSAECKLHCLTTTHSTKAPQRTDLVHVVVGAGAVMVVLFVLGVFATHMVTKRFTKRKLLSLSSQTTAASPDSCQDSLVYSEEPPELHPVKAQNCVMEQETSNLPDCVPLEIRIPELIYSVLDLVPVLQVKQLVRSLGVKDSEIEQAELDHRFCKEAHYQMLRVWAERGSRAAGGGGTLLLPPLLQELMDKLRMMHLGRAAEELEAKFCIQ